MTNFYFNKSVRICDVVVHLPCEECPLGHILTGSQECPEFQSTKEIENFLKCIRNCSEEVLLQLKETIGD